MDKLNRMAIFATVVQEGSLAAAARRLGISSSAISQHLRSLERELDVSLLRRSTRRLTLTDAGGAFYPGCQEMLRQATLAQQRLAEMRDQLIGELRITATIGIGGKPLVNALSPLLAAHPQLTLTVLADDGVVDMIDKRVDIALRVNRQLQDSNLIAHPLAVWPMMICAAPSYLAQHPLPEKPDDLLQHRWIAGHRNLMDENLALRHLNGQERQLRLNSAQVVSSSMHVVRAFTCAGLGLSVQPIYEITDELQRGELVPVLNDWQPIPLQLHALTLTRTLTEKSRYALQHLRDYFQQLGEK